MLTVSNNRLVKAVHNGGYLVHHGEGLFSAYCHKAGSYVQCVSLNAALEHMRQGLGRTQGCVDCWDALTDTWDSEYSLSVE